MGKHSKSKHSSEGSNGKKVVLIIITLIVIIALVFGIFFFVYKVNESNKVEGVINSFFEALKNSNQETVNQYADYNQLINSIDEMILQDDSDELEKELFNNIEWVIEDVEKNDNETVAIVEVKNKDFKDVMTNWMKELVSAKSAGIEVTNEYALEKLTNELKEEENFKTVIKKITVKEDNGNMKIIVNEDLRDLVFPGIDSVIEVLGNN